MSTLPRTASKTSCADHTAVAFKFRVISLWVCRCHDKGVTVQGAVSAASAVANAAVQAKEFPLPQTLLLQCPCSVRDQVTCLLHLFRRVIKRIHSSWIYLFTLVIKKTHQAHTRSSTCSLVICLSSVVSKFCSATANPEVRSCRHLSHDAHIGIHFPNCNSLHPRTGIFSMKGREATM